MAVLKTIDHNASESSGADRGSMSGHGEEIHAAVQKRALLKFDMVVMGCFGVMYLLANLDRNNLGNTQLMGLPEDLGLVGNQFGNAVSIFYATYVTLETPLSILLKLIGPKYLLSACFFGWGIVCLCMGFIKTANHLYACRLLLGIFEAGLIPCINTYIGMVYLKSEMSIRSAVYYAFGAIAGAFGGLLALGVSHLKTDRFNSWSWLFIIEGSVTIFLVPVVFVLFPKDPLTAWFLNDKEQAVMRLRHELNPHLNIDDTFTWQKVLSAFKDPKTYLHAVVQFSVDISLFGFTTFMPALIRGMGYSGAQAQALTVPVYVWATIAYFSIALFADRSGLRGPYILGALLFLVAGYGIMIGTDNVAARYTALFIIAVGIYPTTGIAIVWLNANFAGHYKRATAVGAVFTVENTWPTTAPAVFPTGSAPRYLPGLRVALGLACLAILVVCVLMGWLHWENRRREKILAMADGEGEQVYVVEYRISE
ncbi:major facilitator superfamily domain-containing protein [Aspergillus cavernicola]|uniref:Major facilitator superfamily domain-containing protein n=1 Tax=Aspergillus cavernicola TaxID=176166 RepID=A0ABR4HBW8_9EURO